MSDFRKQFEEVLRLRASQVDTIMGEVSKLPEYVAYANLVQKVTDPDTDAKPEAVREMKDAEGKLGRKITAKNILNKTGVTLEEVLTAANKRAAGQENPGLTAV